MTGPEPGRHVLFLHPAQPSLTLGKPPRRLPGYQLPTTGPHKSSSLRLDLRGHLAPCFLPSGSGHRVCHLMPITLFLAASRDASLIPVHSWVGAWQVRPDTGPPAPWRVFLRDQPGHAPPFLNPLDGSLLGNRGASIMSQLVSQASAPPSLPAPQAGVPLGGLH